MLFYHQISGELLWDKQPLGTGYSGYGTGKNEPTFENVPNVGPIPLGLYTVSLPYDDKEKGPITFRLTPAEETNTYNRSDFLIHGDSFAHPGMSSHGCIVAPHAVRQMIAASKDPLLKVVR